VPVALGQVVVVEGGGATVALETPSGDPQTTGQGVEFRLVVGQEMGPAILALADGGPLPPVVQVDGQ
jgi:hypothetical protein